MDKETLDRLLASMTEEEKFQRVNKLVRTIIPNLEKGDDKEALADADAEMRAITDILKGKSETVKEIRKKQ